jgi:hypothetical protein
MATNVRALDPAQALRDRVIRTIRDHEAEVRALGVEKTLAVRLAAALRCSSTAGRKALLTMVRDRGSGPCDPGNPCARPQGASLDERRANLREVLELCLEEQAELRDQPPKFVGVQQIEIG